MKYLMYNINGLKREIDSDSLVEKCRKNQKNFTQNRKLHTKDLVLFTLNNRGKTLKMELCDYIKEFNLEVLSLSILSFISLGFCFSSRVFFICTLDF